jgi:hypothetical protein
MIAQKDISNSKNYLTADSPGPLRSSPDTCKEKWLQKYASRILMVWSKWQPPLGVTSNYRDKIKTDLVGFYDDPLKRMFIETTY